MAHMTRTTIRQQKTMDFRKGEHKTAPKDSGNGVRELTGRCDDWRGQSHGKSSREGMRAKDAMWAEAYESESEDLNAAEGARVLVRNGFEVQSFYGYSGQVVSRDARNENDEIVVIYAMFEEQTVVVEINGFCLERQYNPALAAAVEEMCRQEEEMGAIDHIEARLLWVEQEKWIAAARAAGCTVYWHDNGEVSVMTQTELKTFFDTNNGVWNEFKYLDRSQEDLYEACWLESLGHELNPHALHPAPIQLIGYAQVQLL